MNVIELEKLLKSVKNRKLGVLALGYSSHGDYYHKPVVAIKEDRDGVYIFAAEAADSDHDGDRDND